MVVQLFNHSGGFVFAEHSGFFANVPTENGRELPKIHRRHIGRQKLALIIVATVVENFQDLNEMSDETASLSLPPTG
jgi:hypothetical protein